AALMVRPGRPCRSWRGAAVMAIRASYGSLTIVVEGPVHSPPKASRLVLVTGFKDEQHGTDLEEGGADKGRYPLGDGTLALELGAGGHEGQPGEEAAGDEDGAANGEGHGDEVGDVPVGALGGHALQ